MTAITQIKALDVPTAITQRRSIKTFKSDPINPKLLSKLLELTVAAPSSFGMPNPGGLFLSKMKPKK